MSVPLTNTKDVVANNIYLINSDGTLKNVIDIVGDLEGGLTPEQLQTLSQISTAINNDPLFFTTIQNQINSKRNILDSYNQIETDTKLNSKLNTSDFNTTNATNLTNQNLVNTTNQNSINNINNVLNTKLNILDNNVTLTSLFNNVNSRVLTTDYNFKVDNINTTFGTKINILDNNVTLTSLLNNVNSRVLTTDYNFKVDDINTTFGTKINISDNNVTVTSLFNNINSRVLTGDYNLKVDDINTTFGTKLNISDNNATLTSLFNNVNSRVLTSDYNLKIDNINTTFGTKLNISDNNATLTSLFNNVNSRVLTSDYNLKIDNINTTFGTKLNISDNNATLTSLLNNVNSRVLTSDYNLKVGDINTTFGSVLNTTDNNINTRVLTSDYNLKIDNINTTFGTKLNILDNNATLTSLFNNVNSRVLTNDYNLKVGDINTTFGTRVNISENNATLTSLLTNVNSRALNSEFITLKNTPNCKFTPQLPLLWGLNSFDNNGVLEWKTSLILDSDYTYTQTQTSAILSTYDTTITSNTKLSNKLDQLTTTIGGVGGEQGKTIEVEIIQSVPNSTFRGGNSILMNCHQLALPYSLLVGTDIIYNGGLYYHDTPIEEVILYTCSNKSNITDNNVTFTSLFNNVNSRVLTSDYNLKISNINATFGTILNTTDNNINNRVLTSDYNLKISDINTTFGTKVNISDNNATLTSIFNNVNSRLLTSDYNLKIDNINTTLGTKLNISDYSTSSNSIISAIDTKINDRVLSTRSQITVGTCFCQYDLRCGDFQCNYVSGPILFQINSMIDTKITPVTASINAIKYTKVFELVRYYPNIKFINLGRINLPLGGSQCEIQLSGSYGWNINNATGVAQDKYTFPNFTATCYIQSSSPGSRRKIFPNSFNTWAPLTPSYDLCHSGYVIVNSPNFMPRGFYLAPVPADNENYVDIWYESLPWSGPLLLKVTQITGGFTTSTEAYDSMPLWGYVKLDMFLNSCFAIYRNPYNI